jgi:alcohol dehydrogenase
MTDFDQAGVLLKRFKGETYANGFGVLNQAGPMAAALGRRAALVVDRFPGADAHSKTITGSLAAAGVTVAGAIPGAAPNAPLEDLARIHQEWSA